MRILLTADLHYNHARSKPLAEDLIHQINSTGGDVLVVIGDTGVADGDSIEACLSRFKFSGPKLFVSGNHELWTKRSDSYALYTKELPERIRSLGWQWLETKPFVAGDVAIVGSVGWYDYSFASERLEIPHRFYAAKISPGAAEQNSAFNHLFETSTDISPTAREFFARWNDGKFVKLGRSDEDFLAEILQQLSKQLTNLAKKKTVIACVHHVPFHQLLPPPHSSQWDFAKAFLGSEKLGQLLLAHPNVRHVFCGHSHLATQRTIDHIDAVNIGSGYRWKTFRTLDAG